jgi:hypothetical protein
MNTIHIVGAGLAGLLAAGMLKKLDPQIFETQRTLPNNHSAVLRFRTSAIGDVLGIPFRQVTLVKSIQSWKNPAADALAYSMKIGGESRSDRSINSGERVDSRWIAPLNLIETMAKDFAINYGTPYPFATMKGHGVPIISTIPMPALMDELRWKPKPKFNYMHGYNISATIERCNAYVSLMVPDPAYPFSRISITGNHLIVEIPQSDGSFDMDAETWAHMAANLLGIDPARISNVRSVKQTYVKILPMDEDVRREFIYTATTEFNIYSLGRYATWRPGLILDDLVKDVRLIEGWLTRRKDSYARARTAWASQEGR